MVARGRKQRSIPRRNPRAPAAPKNPTVVLVRRFDPTGETLPRWEVLARGEEGNPEFFSPLAAKKAALSPPRDADLRIGDIIVTVPAEAISGIEEYATGLFVVTPDGVKAPPKPPGETWLATWGQNAYEMLRASGKVNRRRLVMAACDCAETVMHLVPAGEDRPRTAIEVARAWCFGKAWLAEVRSAAAAAYASRYYAAYYAAITAAKATTDTAKAAVADVAVFGTSGMTYRTLAPLVERWIPLPVALLSRLGYPNAIPFNPDLA